MAKKKRRLGIGTPCANVWEELEPRDGGRFCPQCEKVVLDLSDATARRAWATIDGAEGKLCVRIRADADGAAVFRRPAKPPGSARFAAIAAGALLAACEPGAAAEHSPVVEVAASPEVAEETQAEAAAADTEAPSEAESPVEAEAGEGTAAETVPEAAPPEAQATATSASEAPEQPAEAEDGPCEGSRIAAAPRRARRHARAEPATSIRPTPAAVDPDTQRRREILMGDPWEH